MRESRNAFHLAIPVGDLDEASSFYESGLGCRIGRRYADRISVDFFGDQLVCHLSERWEREPPDLYPRHFGVTFRDRQDFDDILQTVADRGLPLHSPCQPRFAGRREEHLTVVLRDPSNNLIEFKWYLDPAMMY